MYTVLNSECVDIDCREEHERIGDIIKRYGHFLKVQPVGNFIRA